MSVFHKGIALALALCTLAACGSEDDPLVREAVDASCIRDAMCEEDPWFESLEDCAAASYSLLAAFEHVYGQVCLEAWVAFLDCESTQPCDERDQCDPEDDAVSAACF